MPKGDIKISPKHGLNPSLDLCLFCGESKGVAILGRLKDDAEAPRQAIFDHDPCNKCRELMETMILLVKVDHRSDPRNPTFMGHTAGVTEDFVRRVLQPESTVDAVLARRAAFVTDDVWKVLGIDEAIKNLK